MAEDVVGYEWNRSARRLADGDAALSVGGSYEALALAERLGVSLDELWSLVGFVPIPAGPRGSPASLTGTMVYGIFRQAAQPKLAMRLLEQVVSPRGARRHLARDRPDSPETVCRRARGARASVRRADGDDARQCGDATRDAALPTRLGPAPVDARDGAHGPARCCERSAPCRRAHRRDHWATRRRRDEAGSPLTSSTFSARRKPTMSRLPLDFVQAELDASPTGRAEIRNRARLDQFLVPTQEVGGLDPIVGMQPGGRPSPQPACGRSRRFLPATAPRSSWPLDARQGWTRATRSCPRDSGRTARDRSGRRARSDRRLNQAVWVVSLRRGRH